MPEHSSLDLPVICSYLGPGRRRRPQCRVTLGFVRGRCWCLQPSDRSEGPPIHNLGTRPIPVILRPPVRPQWVLVPNGLGQLPMHLRCSIAAFTASDHHRIDSLCRQLHQHLRSVAFSSMHDRAIAPMLSTAMRRGNKNQCDINRRMLGGMPVWVCCAIIIVNPPSW